MKNCALRIRPMIWACLFGIVPVAAPQNCSAQSPITNGLLNSWPLDGDAKDSAGESDGQISGGVSHIPGPAGQAMQFNGSTGGVDFGTTAGNFGAADFSIAYWMKTGSSSQIEAFLDKRPTCDGYSSFFDIRVGAGNNRPGYLNLEITAGLPGSPEYCSYLSTHPVNDGAWHHVVWSRQSSSGGNTEYRLYLDGKLDTSTNVEASADIHNDHPLLLGRGICECCDGTRPYSGAAADLQFFSHGLSPAEVSALYKAGKPQPAAAGAGR
jgi:hypothetical protein